MRCSAMRLAYVPSLPLLLVLNACGGASGGRPTASYSAVEAVPISPPRDYASAPREMTETEGLLIDRPIAGAPAVRAVGSVPGLAAGSSGGAASGLTFASAPAVTSPPGARPVNPPKEGEMLDVEARVTMECEKVFECAKKARELARSLGGQIINDSTTDSYGSVGSALSLRLPSGKPTTDFLSALEGFGRVKSKNITSKDVGKEFFDAQIVLENLEATMRRYQEILAKATEVKEILLIENELTRVRTQIDRTKGDLRYLKDRASRSTVYLTLGTIAGTKSDTVSYMEEAKFYPGLRLGYALDNRGEAGRKGYLGFSFSLQFTRHFSIDLDMYRESGTGLPTKGLDLFLATLGGDMYSDFLGGGKRRYLNPYIGFRIGYGRMLGFNEMAIGGTVGIELFKSKSFVVDINARAYAMFANPEVGAHAIVQPSLGANVAF